MASRSGSCRAIPIVALDFYSCKSVVGFTPSVSRSDSKSDELAGSEKGIPAPSHASTPTPIYITASVLTLAKSTPALKYSEADLIKILKIFLETKSQKPRPEVPYKQSLKAKVSDVYLVKMYMDYYHFC